MGAVAHYFMYRAAKNYNGTSEEEQMEAPDLKRRVVKTDDVKPSGDDVNPDKAGEDALKGAMKGSDDVKANCDNKEKKDKKDKKPKTKDEAMKAISNQLAEGDIDLDTAIKEVRSL